MLNKNQAKTDQNRKESYIIAYGSAICLVITILYMTLIYTPDIKQTIVNYKQVNDSLQRVNDSLETAHKVNCWGIIRDNGTSREIYNTILEDKKERVKLYKN
jgi:hypothetical protein